jgi:seryl-tRNA synthetase
MLDISLLRKDLAHVVARLETRASPQPFLDVARFSALENERKALQTRTEELQARRNVLSREIGKLRRRAATPLPRWPTSGRSAASSSAPPIASRRSRSSSARS